MPIEPDVSPSQWLSSLPIFCFAYHGHMPSVKIYRRMENRRMFKWTALSAFSICFVIYNLCSAFASATFGRAVQADLLLAYPAADVAMYPARIGIIGCVCAPYAVYTIMARGIIYESTNPKYRCFFAIGWFLLSFLVAVFWPNFDAILQLMGSLMALLIFTFPGIALMVTYTNSRLSLSIFGAVLACLGTYLFCYTFISTIFGSVIA